ncbi:UDP-forming cellulose synthase catalytic subunit [Acidithiobacillus sp. MC6.1]|uniref:Cellulose synthase catalytic subunit [UDP-forming] n=1 Tax=Acidithiobacillus ferrivorans TaxID=160808 RepID=A0A1B9BWH5_9PROT|nr:UDP-forming cellulose synthase catalytic subunit [Acidithiobacillus ferrivorans]MBN6740837.1 UDP-forming cellulose synthase catalytic subunit [Acidithiobacillus sp. MC6.1]OCB02046.1 cellulose synthase catalytic subunit (UDP-forming) [Acidithiobacillus ferrivorans]
MSILSERITNGLQLALLALGLTGIIGLVNLPVSNASQAYVSAAFVLMLMVILFIYKRTSASSEYALTALRVLCMSISVYMIFRYLIWRAEYTIGGYGVISLIAGLLLFVTEIYAASYSMLGFFVSFYPRQRKSPALPADAELPVVDVLVPTYNEPEEILEITLLGATNIDYPKGKLFVHLLDDGGTDDRCQNPKISDASQQRRARLLSLCQRVGAIYHTRMHNDNAKAGNINAALNGLEGDLILIIDADHVPAKAILRETVGFLLKDPLCAVVQTPHSFINPDPIEKNLDIMHDSPPETELFQQYIQSGLDGWGASFFCGSAAVIRRSMLMEVGGIQTDTLTEDVETAMMLHSKGYHSVFLNKSLVVGLQPETVTSFIQQRIRWAQGAIQILQVKNPLRLKGLKLTQRIAYVTSFSYWFFPYARLVNMLAPSMFLLFGIMIYNATAWQYAIYGVPYFIATWIYSDLAYGKVRWPLASDVYEMVQAPLASIMLLGTLLRPGKRSFKVTPKGEHLGEDFISSAAKVQVVFFTIVFISLLVGIWRWFSHPGERPQLIFTMLWEIINFIIMLATLVVMFERKQVRGSYRVAIPLDMPATMEMNGKSIAVRVDDLSVNGARLQYKEELIFDKINNNQLVTLNIVDSEASKTMVSFIVEIIYQSGGWLGARFVYQDLAEKRAVVDFMYGNAKRLEDRLEKRRGRKSFAAAYAYFIYKTTQGGVIFLRHMWRASSRWIRGRAALILDALTKKMGFSEKQAQRVRNPRDLS